MVAYNFQSRFAPLVASGEKRQTIRPIGKRRHAKAGDMLQLYTGQRTKRCRLLATAECLGASKIVIEENMVSFDDPIDGDYAFVYTLQAYKDDFSRSDGFKSWVELRDFFDEKYGLPFTGVLIQWCEPIPPP